MDNQIHAVDLNVGKMLHEQKEQISTHSFSPEQMSDDILARMVRLCHSSLLKVPLP